MARPGPESPVKKVTLYMPVSLWKKIQELAEEGDVTASDFVRWSVELNIKKLSKRK